MLRTRGLRTHLHEERERGAQHLALAEPAKLKLGPALPRACSTDSPIDRMGLASR